MFDWLTSLTHLNAGQLMAAGVAIVAAIFMLWNNRDKLPALKIGQAPDDDTQDFQAYRRLKERFASVPDAQAALKTLATHFFDAER